MIASGADEKCPPEVVAAQIEAAAAIDAIYPPLATHPDEHTGPHISELEVAEELLLDSADVVEIDSSAPAAAPTGAAAPIRTRLRRLGEQSTPAAATTNPRTDRSLLIAEPGETHFAGDRTHTLGRPTGHDIHDAREFATRARTLLGGEEPLTVFVSSGVGTAATISEIIATVHPTHRTIWPLSSSDRILAEGLRPNAIARPGADRTDHRRTHFGEVEYFHGPRLPMVLRVLNRPTAPLSPASAIQMIEAEATYNKRLEILERWARTIPLVNGKPVARIQLPIRYRTPNPGAAARARRGIYDEPALPDRLIPSELLRLALAAVQFNQTPEREAARQYFQGLAGNDDSLMAYHPFAARVLRDARVNPLLNQTTQALVSGMDLFLMFDAISHRRGALDQAAREAGLALFDPLQFWDPDARQFILIGSRERQISPPPPQPIAPLARTPFLFLSRELGARGEEEARSALVGWVSPLLGLPQHPELKVLAVRMPPSNIADSPVPYFVIVARQQEASLSEPARLIPLSVAQRLEFAGITGAHWLRADGPYDVYSHPTELTQAYRIQRMQWSQDGITQPQANRFARRALSQRAYRHLFRSAAAVAFRTPGLPILRLDTPILENEDQDLRLQAMGIERIARRNPATTVTAEALGLAVILLSAPEYEPSYQRALTYWSAHAGPGPDSLLRCRALAQETLETAGVTVAPQILRDWNAIQRIIGTIHPTIHSRIVPDGLFPQSMPTVYYTRGVGFHVGI